MKRLDEIEARTNAATEGPWETYTITPAMGSMVLTAPADGEEYGGYVVPEYLDTADAEFIAHARTDVPALVAALRAVVAVHRPVTVPGEVFGTWGEAKKCEDCEQRWPCNTLDAIRRHLGEDQ